jgi:hypothetical protein
MRRWAAVCCALVFAVASCAVMSPRDGLAQAEGNRYLSGTYGFEIRWDDRIWYVISQDIDDQWEELTLADGSSFLFFTVGTGYGGDARPCVDDVVASMISSNGTNDVQQLVDEQGEPVEGGDSERSFAAYTYSYDLGDGTTIEFARYVECQTMIADESVIIADVIAPLAEYETELYLARNVIDEVVLPSPGEPAPVFVSEEWRLAVAAAEQAAEIEAAGLVPRGDDEWLVLVLDATNLQAESADLSVRDFTLRVDGVDEPIRIAPSSTVAAADELETGPASANRAVTFRPDQTRRLTLAFLVPAGATNPVLLRAESALPLSSLLDAGEGLDDLGSAATPPFMREARVDEVFTGGLLSVTFTSDGEDAIVELVGIERLTAIDCHGPAFLDALGELVGETIQFEREDNQPSSNPISGYVWTITEDGLPAQLNQQLLAQGDAKPSDDLEDARFGAWLTESGQEAQQTDRGLWSECG